MLQNGSIFELETTWEKGLRKSEESLKTFYILYSIYSTYTISVYFNNSTTCFIFNDTKSFFSVIDYISSYISFFLLMLPKNLFSVTILKSASLVLGHPNFAIQDSKDLLLLFLGKVAQIKMSESIQAVF